MSITQAFVLLAKEIFFGGTFLKETVPSNYYHNFSIVMFTRNYANYIYIC